jgi:hypothetical protein
MLSVSLVLNQQMKVLNNNNCGLHFQWFSVFRMEKSVVNFSCLVVENIKEDTCIFAARI